ncbi:hypothetical protein EDD37DRAFT_629345, partial [Exophiala viscosa]|uniref:uncharacterized protein n=1 Tax=Exophiala viscosa TaxID=2486360 RepID=UPI00219B2770
MSRRSARLSAFAVADNNNQHAEAEDVTDILNAEAGSKQHQSPSKRKRTTGDGSHSQNPLKKRSSREHPATATPHNASSNPTPVRSSGRLQARVRPSGQVRPVHTRNPYELPGDLESAGPQPGIKPIKKMRPLKKKPQQLKVSPFKGRGELETRTTAGVNLDDSPRKSPTRNELQKWKKSMAQTRRNGQTRFASIMRDGQWMVPDESVLEDGHNAPVLGLTPVLAVRVAGEAMMTPSKKKSHPRRDGHKEGQREPSEGSSMPEGGPTPGVGPTERANPLAQAAKVTQQSTPTIPAESPNTQPAPQQELAALDDATVQHRQHQHEPKTISDVPEDAEDVPGVEDGGEALDESRELTPHSPRQRPETESQIQARERQEREMEAERQEKIERELRGVEEAVILYECESAWQEALLGAVEIVESRSSGEPKSAIGKGISRTAKELRDLLKTYRNYGPDDLTAKRACNDKISRKTASLQERCKHICGFQVERPGRERPKMIRDIYEHLIPDLLKLAKASLRARFRNHNLGQKAREELACLLEITILLVDSAKKWRPKPVLGNTIRTTVQQTVKPHVLFILSRYNESIATEGAEAYVANLEEEQTADRERHDMYLEQRRAGVRARHRGYANATSHKQDPQVIDVDNFEREPTEDIPAPAPLQWTDKELMVLLNALQVYTANSRFQDILDKHGGPKGQLSRFDMDQLVAEARWIKQSWAGHLRDCSDRSWDWLRSVP